MSANIEIMKSDFYSVSYDAKNSLYVIENKGTIDDKVFIYGFSTKKEVNINLMPEVEFRPLSIPVTIHKPFEITFNSILVYQGLTLRTVETVVNSVPDLNMFVFREIVQNSLDAELLEKWKENIPEGCCLVGRFGVGLKEALFSLLYKKRFVLIMSDGKAYMPAVFCKNGVKIYNEITEEMNMCMEAVLRGDIKSIGNKTRIYVELPSFEPDDVKALFWNEKGDVTIGTIGNSKVYHNKLYSGNWRLPFNANLCCVSTDQYRTKVSESGSNTLNALKRILSGENVDIITESFVTNAIVKEKMHILSLNIYNDDLFELLRPMIVKAVERILNYDKVNNYVIDDYDDKNVPGVSIRDTFREMIDAIRTDLKNLGYKVFSYNEYVEMTSFETLIKNSDEVNPSDTKIANPIWLAKWLFYLTECVPLVSEGKIARDDCLDTKLHKDIANVPVRIFKKGYEYFESDVAGIMKREINRSAIFLANPEYVEKYHAKEYGLFYTSVTIHELAHYFDLGEHGTFQFEEPWYRIIHFIGTVGTFSNLITNLIKIGMSNINIFYGVTHVEKLDNVILDENLINSMKCENNVCSASCNVAGSDIHNIAVTYIGPFECRLIREGDTLRFEIKL